MNRPNRRYVMRVRWSPRIWEKWLQRFNNPDTTHAEHLRGGIESFRQACAQREKSAV